MQPAYAQPADVLQEEAAILGADKLEDALPAEAEEALDGISLLEQGRFSDGFKQILAGAVKGTRRMDAAGRAR